MVLITGATSGLGRELSFEAALRGYSLALVSRDEAALNKVRNEIRTQYPKSQVEVLAIDLAGEFEQKSFPAGWAEQVRYLILNASQNLFSETGAMPEREEDLIRINIFSMYRMSTIFKKSLKENKGALVGVTSIASFYSIGYQNLYHASKAFQLSFLRGLSRENPGFHVMPVIVGPFHSKMNHASGLKVETAPWLRSDPKILAKKIWNDIEKGAAVSRPDLYGKIFWLLFQKYILNWLGVVQTGILSRVYSKRLH